MTVAPHLDRVRRIAADLDERGPGAVAGVAQLDADQERSSFRVSFALG
jgi:hypothetical protein